MEQGAIHGREFLQGAPRRQAQACVAGQGRALRPGVARTLVQVRARDCDGLGRLLCGWAHQAGGVKGRATGASYAEMLLDVVFSEAQVLFGDTESRVLLEELAPPHTAKVCRAVRKELGYCLLPWVPQCPDLNPIENAWDYLDRAIRAVNPQFKTKEDLFQALSDACDNIPQAYFVSLLDSMPTRMVAVTKTKGFPTKY